MAKKAGNNGIGWLVIGGILLYLVSSGKDDPPAETIVTPPPNLTIDHSATKPEPNRVINSPVATSELVPVSIEEPKPDRNIVSDSARYEYFVTTARLRVRSSPSTNAAIMKTLDKGAQVATTARLGEWYQVPLDGSSAGWVHGGYLSKPTLDEPARLFAPSKPRRREAIAQPQRRSGEPIRAPYVGTCDCPYDIMRNGQRCGGRSAYSRPGGRQPICYM